MMNDDIHRNIPDDELDRIIRSALVVDAEATGVERLNQYWRVQSRKDRWQRRAYFALTTSAAALVLFSLVIVARDGDEDAETASVAPEQVQAPADKQVKIDPTVRIEGIEATSKPSPEPSQKEWGLGELAGRTPTAYERFLFVVRTGKPTNAMAEGTVEELNRPRPANAEKALAEIEHSGGVAGLVRTAKRARELHLQRAAMARLLEIKSDESLLGFLALVRDGSTQASALVAADSASELPLDALLALLDHEDKAVRRSAALLLGHVNGPEVTQALIARVTEVPAATEAWMALVACRGERAQQFVAYAATRPQLLGHLNGARVQMAYAIP
jgi:hypothetical protein